ncbi:MAG: NifB/NifX family molybdenum-iron cluster-binding protein [Phycisphaerae bacterium]|nr:NifB/NifX family molybdenum-iron cluster-binding protein [Phycisphaerae bacterium]
MKIAIPIADGKLCMHFGHCEKFAIVQIDKENKTIGQREDLTPPAHEPGVLPKWIGDLGVDLVIAGGMGQRAQQLFEQNNVMVLVGAPADSPEILAEMFLNNELKCGTNICDH